MALRYGLRVRIGEEDRESLTVGDRARHRAVFLRACGLSDLPSGARFLRFSDLTWYRSESDGSLTDRPDELTAQIAFESPRAVEAFLGPEGPAGRLPGKADGMPLRFGRDPRIALADAWLPVGFDGGIFGDRAMALAAINAHALPPHARGEGVNVAIVDMGLLAAQLRRDKRDFGARATADQRVHGWSRYDRVYDGTRWTRRYQNAGAGWIRHDRSLVMKRTPYEFLAHAHMIARNVLSIAPEARIWDVPLVGDDMVPPGLSTASAILNRIRAFRTTPGIRVWREDEEGQDEAIVHGARSQPWVIVNAWGVFDTGSDLPDLTSRAGFEYGDHPDHFLVDDLPALEKAGLDLVFCAGNCGDPLADVRCGEFDRGPGRGIMGLNAHPSVLTVGAVRVDELPIAQSSQGPGRLSANWAGSRTAGTVPAGWEHEFATAARCKPDVSAPSHFRDSVDDGLYSRGSSAAAGLAAGVIAALRSIFPDTGRVQPWQLRKALRDGARKARGQDAPWDPRLGYGIIDVGRTIELLRRGPVTPAPPSGPQSG